MRPHPALMTARILWFALFVATFMYMGIAYGVLQKPGVVPPQTILPHLFGGVAVVIAAISFVLPFRTYDIMARAADLKVEEEVASSAFPNRYREAMPKRSVFADPAAAATKAYACFLTPFILSMALSEAIALFGIVLASLGFEKSMSLPFFLTGAVLVAIRFPRQSKIIGMFEKARGASFPAQNG